MLWSMLDHYRDLGLLILRLGFGLGFTWFHGVPKLMGGMEAMADRGAAMANFGVTFGYEWWGLVAALVETLGGLSIALGLLFRPACLALLAVMTAATMDNFAGRGDPSHSFKNAWLFLGLFFVGPGRFSLDALFDRRRRPL